MKCLVISIYRIIFCRPVARKINQFLFQCAAHGLGILNYKNTKQTGEEWLVEHFLKRELKEDSVVFDVGANKGNYMKMFLDRISCIQYYAFEPNFSAFEMLQKKSKLCAAKSVTHVNAAVSSSSGQVSFYQLDEVKACEKNTLHEEVLKGCSYSKTEVASVTLDEFTKRNEIKTIDFLKVDTEGHELQVLKGAKKLINSGNIKMIQFEFNEMNLSSRSTMRDFRKELTGYTFFRLSPYGLILLPDLALYQEVYAFQNVFCMKKS